MRSKKKKRIIIALGLGFLCIITGFGWYAYKENQRFSPAISNPNPRFEDLVLMETGSGSGREEDTCLVIEKNTADIWRYYKHFRVIPGKYVFFTERDGKVEELAGNAYREKFYWEYVQTNVYEIATGNLVKSINVKALIEEKAPGYQYDKGSAEAFTGKNGHIFLRWSLCDIPADGNQEPVSKYLCMDYETGEIYIEETLQTLYGATEKQEIFKEEFYNHGWGAYLEQNEFTDFNDEAENEKRYFEYTAYGPVTAFVNGFADIRITTSALPKENEELYSRFPGLKDYQGKEGMVARIFLGGYPTAEEMQQLFVEEAVE